MIASRAVNVLGAMSRMSWIVFRCTAAFFHFWLWVPVLLLWPGLAARAGEGRRAAVLRHAAFVFRLTLQHLGATFIKVGQILSTRPDILPRPVIDELANLQDKVPPRPFSEIRTVVETDLGRSLETAFASFERAPIASASVAQVHRAVLEDGTVVAVKVRRPEVPRQVAFDESVMVLLARLVSWIPTVHLLSPEATVHEFCFAVREQLDFRKEAANNRRFQENFKGDPDIRFPALFEPLCGEAVLTMEFVNGVKDTELDRLGLDTKRLARIGARAILHMVYSHGFVHADLHPGNILYQPDHKVVLIDLGMVGLLDDTRRNGLAATILALARNDGRTVARFLYEGSPHKAVPDYAEYEADVCKLVASTQGKAIGDLEMSVLIGQVFDIARRHRLRADAAFTTVNIAMLVVEGLGKKLDPTFDMFTFVQPYLFEVLSRAPELLRQVVPEAAPT